MSTYKALDPNVEVIGAAIMAITNSMGDAAAPILKKHSLYPLVYENWYKQQDWLNAFSEISAESFMNLVAVGLKIPDSAVWPPDIQTVHDALSSINVAYNMNHRYGEIGGYHYEKTGETSGKMICDNPYPSDFDYGIIYRTVQKFTDPENSNFVVRVDASQPTRKRGESSCTYLITW